MYIKIHFTKFISGKGELFMWGKNAGLIHSDKSSQYFQYTPHHIEMDGMSVVQVELCKIYSTNDRAYQIHNYSKSKR
jgi:hypothetical protein